MVIFKAHCDYAVPLLDAIFERRSVRHYKRKQVPKKVLRNILEAARLAPSATNAQPWHFIVITDQEKRMPSPKEGGTVSSGTRLSQSLAVEKDQAVGQP